MSFSEIKVGSLVIILDAKHCLGLCSVGDKLTVAKIDSDGSLLLNRTEDMMNNFATNSSKVWINPIHTLLIK